MIHIYKRVRAADLPDAVIRKTVLAVLRRLRAPDVDVSIHFVGNERIRRLNRLYRGVDRPTDVLAFAVREGAWVVKNQADWGDVFLAVPYIRRQAKNNGIPYLEEAVRMLIHGTLHIAGYDHRYKDEAAEMFGLQEELLHQVVK